MLLSLFRQMKLTHLLYLGFGLMLLCIVVTVGANLSAASQHLTTTDLLFDHLYPARQSAQVIVRLTLAIDDNGAQYILSYDPQQQAHLLQTYRQDVQALHVAIAQAAALADTPQQRAALADFTQYFFGSGGYYEDNQSAFAQKQAGQQLTASDNYVDSPFLPTIQHDMQIYTSVVEGEIAQADARENVLANVVRFLNIGLGGSAVLFGLGVTVFIIRSIHRLYQQIEEKNARLAENNTRLHALSTTDPLTELPNHRALLSTLKQELERAQRYSRPCSLLFLDLDHFKAFNDGYGHAAGDTVLRDFAGTLKTTTRSMDTVGRWGGEEFVVILPEATIEEALEVAERIRKAVSFHCFDINGGLHLTCSIGVACYPEHSCEQDALISAADKAMYGAKHLGRNQVRLVSDSAVTALLNREAAEGGREEIALRGTVEALVTLVEERDRSLGHHSQQVSELARQLARAVGMSQEEAQGVALAGLLHDIGKVAVSDAILQKPGPLTEEEKAQMRKHSIVAAEVLNHIPSLRPLVPVIRAHHERWDGHGYPDQLKAEQIPLAARLVAVIDAYTVMITEQVYQHACSSTEALEELRHCAGTQFDPLAVETLCELLQERQDQQQREVLHVA
ncbi:MAG: diguanylate cyclase [Ktedonobacteraceae bacterium]